MASDFFGNIGNALTQGFNDISKAAGDECNKIGSRTAKNLKADCDEIADGIKKNGFAGGACATFDVLTPGHATAEILDDAGVVTDPAMKQLIASGVNIGIGGCIPGAGLLLQADGIAEGIDGVSKLFGGAKAQPGVPQQNGSASNGNNSNNSNCAPSQGNQSPRSAYTEAQRERAIESAKMKSAEKLAYVKGFEAGERAGERKGIHEGIEIGERRYTTLPVNGGWATGPSYGQCGSPADTIGQGYDSMDDMCGQYFGNGATDQISDKIKQLLNAKGLSFEDRIFLLMQNVVGSSQDQISKQAQAIGDQSDKNNKAIDSLNGQIDTMRQANPNDPKLQGLVDKRDQLKATSQESRQDAFQDLQQATSKLSEMQQALSGTLNSLHDTAMSTIRNIK